MARRKLRDNGRGIPVDNEPKTGLPGVELIMTRLHAGGKFGGGSYTASGGLHGVGASVVNALSARLDVCVEKAGYEWAMSFRRGVPGQFAGDGPDVAFTAGSGLRKGRKVAKTATGTRIRFWPDRQIFVPGADWKFSWLAQQARQTAYLVPGLAIRITDERVVAERRDEFSRTVGRGDGSRREQPAGRRVQVCRRHQRVLRAPVHRGAGHRCGPDHRQRECSPRRCRCSTTPAT